MIHRSAFGRFIGSRVVPFIRDEVLSPGTNVRGTVPAGDFRPGTPTSTPVRPVDFGVPLAAPAGCPPGQRNVRSPALTAILGPDCRVSTVQMEPRIPPMFDPMGLIPQREVPGQVPMANGIPAQPLLVAQRQCPRGPDGRRMVLAAFPGQPEMCWPAAMVPRQFRSNPRRAKPPVTAADARAIRRADSARKRLVRLTKASGAHASMTRPRPRPKLPPHQHVVRSLPPGA